MTEIGAPARELLPSPEPALCARLEVTTFPWSSGAVVFMNQCRKFSKWIKVCIGTLVPRRVLVFNLCSVQHEHAEREFDVVHREFVEIGVVRKDSKDNADRILLFG